VLLALAAIKLAHKAARGYSAIEPPVVRVGRDVALAS
jgi:hypothetical protein